MEMSQGRRPKSEVTLVPDPGPISQAVRSSWRQLLTIWNCVTKIGGTAPRGPIGATAALALSKGKCSSLTHGSAVAVSILHWMTHRDTGLPGPALDGIVL